MPQAFNYASPCPTSSFCMKCLIRWYIIESIRWLWLDQDALTPRSVQEWNAGLWLQNYGRQAVHRVCLDRIRSPAGQTFHQARLDIWWILYWGLHSKKASTFCPHRLFVLWSTWGLLGLAMSGTWSLYVFNAHEVLGGIVENLGYCVIYSKINT